jgi:Tfp pilus assembly protein PilF
MTRFAAFLSLWCVLVSGCATISEKEAGGPSISDNETEIAALREKGMQAYGAGDLAAAEQSLARIVERHPRNAQVWFHLGNIYAETGRPREAVTAYYNALIVDPGLAKARHNLGLVRLRQAVYDFMALTDSVPPDDPLHARGKRMSEAILDLIDQLPESGGAQGEADSPTN